MGKNSNEVSTGTALLMTLGIMLVIGMIISAGEPKCSMSRCDNDAKEGSRYCYLHDLSYGSYGNPDYNEVYRNSQNRRNNSTTSSSSKKYSSYDSYDEGYEDVYEDEDYDWDRYYSDDDYAGGVDDAMDELDW